MATNDLDAVLADLRAHRERLARDLTRVDDAISALTGDGRKAAPTPAATPMVDRVAELLAEHPNRVFTAEGALETLQEQGWESDASDPVNAMRTTLSRMARKGDIIRVDRGHYAHPKVLKFSDPWARPDSKSNDPWGSPAPTSVDPWATTEDVPQQDDENEEPPF